MIVILTTLLILLCLVIVLLILIQRTSGGMGSALGGGAADQVLGAGSAAQLTKFTVYGIVGFFIMAFVLYGFYQDQSADSDSLIRGLGNTDFGIRAGIGRCLHPECSDFRPLESPGPSRAAG